jgi:hypothetical protein
MRVGCVTTEIIGAAAAAGENRRSRSWRVGIPRATRMDMSFFPSQIEYLYLHNNIEQGPRN